MKLVGILTQSSELCNFRGRLISNYNYSSLFKFASKDISVISIGNTSSNININNGSIIPKITFNLILDSLQGL